MREALDLVGLTGGATQGRMEEPDVLGHPLDVIARRGRLIVVCEVRSRTKGDPVHPAETIDRKKLERLLK